MCPSFFGSYLCSLLLSFVVRKTASGMWQVQSEDLTQLISLCFVWCLCNFKRAIYIYIYRSSYRKTERELEIERGEREREREIWPVSHIGSERGSFDYNLSSLLWDMALCIYK